MPAQSPTPRIVNVEHKFWPGCSRLYYDESKADHVIFAGVGYGKSTFGRPWLFRRIRRNLTSKSRKVFLMAPTQKHLSEDHIPQFQEYLARYGLREKIHYTINRQTLVLTFTKQSKELAGYKVFFISMETPKTLVQFEFDAGWWDEPGFGPELVKEQVDQRVGRSAGVQLGQVLYTGVVQIPNWYLKTFGQGSKLRRGDTYHLPQWVENYAPGYGGIELVRYRESDRVLCLHASTFENGTLNAPYYHRQWNSYGYKPAKFRGQVLGEAIAINTNAVYDEFDEAACVGNYPVDCHGPTPHLNLAFDFNVGRMSAVVIQSYWGGSYYVVWECRDEVPTTYHACHAFIEAFPVEKYGDRLIRVFGDSAGWAQSRQTIHRDCDYSIIRDVLGKAGYRVKVMAPEHTVEQPTRVMSTNKFHALAKINNGLARGRGLYADKSCHKVINGWRVVSWNLQKGKIHKPGTEDDQTHAPEAVDYFMYVEEPPIDRPTAASRRSG